MAEPPRDPRQDKLKDLREKVDLAQQVGERLRAYRAAVYAQRQDEAVLLTRRIEESQTVEDELPSIERQSSKISRTSEYKERVCVLTS